MKCPMCGREFSRSEAVQACARCPMARGCILVCCPNCGYQMPGETRLGALLRRLKEWAGGVKR